jgi:dienelactone hydrolase
MRNEKDLVTANPLARLCILLALAVLPALAHAQTVIFQEPFNVGIGSFTADGTVNGGGTGASMHGRAQGYSTVTSPAINTTGFNNLQLAWTQLCLNGDAGESCQLYYSVNNITWTLVYTTTFAWLNSPASVALPAAAAGQSQLRLRFVRLANSNEEVYDVDNISLTGTATGGGGGDPCQNGPAPTATSVQGNGPFTVGTYVVPNPSGYKAGTIYYPTNTVPGACAKFAGIVTMPGYQGTQQNLSWLGPRLASNGFVVINVDTNTLSDSPDQRGAQILAALNQLVSLSNATGNPISGKVDSARLGAMGHSMGGGGTLVAARNSMIKAAIPMAPYHNTTTNFSNVVAPTMVITCQGDVSAPAATLGRPMYNSVTQEKAYLELAATAGHLCVMTGYDNKAVQSRYMTSWMKRWLDRDTRYTQFVCGTTPGGSSGVTTWADTCPY